MGTNHHIQALNLINLRKKSQSNQERQEIFRTAASTVNRPLGRDCCGFLLSSQIKARWLLISATKEAQDSFHMENEQFSQGQGNQ